jgi:hypothetical protein
MYDELERMKKEAPVIKVGLPYRCPRGMTRKIGERESGVVPKVGTGHFGEHKL